MPPITVYLAGPYNNCNTKQRTEWRRDIKRALGSTEYKWIDPVEHGDDWTPLKEMVDIERADFVVANLWRESIGTVVGILQATRSGKPVIVIDPNYLSTKVLQQLVGESNIVHSIDKAVNKIQREIAPQLQIDIKVKKRSGSLQQFSQSKLQRSLNTVCSETGINDALLPVLVSHRVRNRVKTDAPAGSIESKRIAELVFEELDELVTVRDGRYSDNLEKHARLLREQWRRQQDLKDERRVLDDLSKTEIAYREEMDRLIEDNRKLRMRLEEAAEEQTRLPAPTFASVGDAVKAASIRFASGLIFHEKAFVSAADCPFLRADDVYDALDLLAQYVASCKDASRQSATVRRLGLQEWLRKQGSTIQYAANESKSTRSDAKAQDQRTCTFQGNEYLLNRHLKLGVGTANECCRIHFDMVGTATDLKILVGHVGRHLRV